MSKHMRRIIVALTLVVFCTGMFSVGFVNEDVFVLAQEVSTDGRFLKVEADVRNISEGMIGFYDSETEKSGFLDGNGNVVIPATYYNVGSFREGLASVGVTPQASGYIDYTGQFIIPPVFSWASEFNGGKAIVSLGKPGCQIIDTTGTLLLKKTYDSIFYDKLLKQYFAFDGDHTDVLDVSLRQLHTFPYLINTVEQVDGKVIGTFFKNDPSCYGAIDLTTGNVIVKEEGTGYTMILNGFLYTNSEEKQSTNIYSLNGLLLAEFGMESVYPINEKTFYTSKDGFFSENYITRNGVKQEVDYRIYTNVLPGLLLIAADSKLNPEAEEILYGVMDKNGVVLLPAVYDRICNDYRSYSTDGNLSQIFIAQKGSICEVYDTKLNKLAVYQDITHCGFTGMLFYLVDAKGFTTVLDGTGKQLGLLDTDGLGIDAGWDQVLAFGWANEPAYAEDVKKPTCYIYLNKSMSQKADVSYAPDAHSPALSYDDIAGLFAELSTNTQSFFTTNKFVKNEVNGNIILPRDWIPKSNIIEGHAYMHPSEITEAFYSFGHRIWPDTCELFYQDKTLRLTYGQKQAVLTYYDTKTRGMAEKTILLDAPVLVSDQVAQKKPGADSPALDSRDSDDRVNMMDGMAFVPLKSAAEALGLSVCWFDGLIGISNKPIALSPQQAAEKKSVLNDMLFNPSSFKALDASLATQPYVDKLVKQTLGITEMWENICAYTNTIPGYEALINKTKDIILVTEPSTEMLARAASKGVELELRPFAKEGFVFLLNKSNPVDTLTVRQLKDIYAGKITNWKEVGGPDAPILAYQRNESSGSQTIMENVFMKDEKLMEPLTERRVMTMQGLVDVIAEFTGEVNHSLGYSVYYYATQMYGNDQVKLVKVDGVLPDPVTIAGDTYPVVVNYYIVTRKGDMGPFAEQMKEYILSPAGQKLLTDVGLVPID